MRHQLETIWREHREELKAFILRRVKSPTESEDILQDVFLKMFTGLQGGTCVAHPRAWLFAIARNAVVDHFRGRRPMEPLPDDLTGRRPQEDGGPLEEIGACLTPMINALPPKLREALILADLQGVPQKEAARRLGVTLAAFKSRILRGRARARRMIEDCCHLELDARGGLMDFVPKGGRRPACGGSHPGPC